MFCYVLPILPGHCVDQDFLDGKPATSSMCLQEFNSLIEKYIVAILVGWCRSTFLGITVALYCCTGILSCPPVCGSKHHLLIKLVVMPNRTSERQGSLS